MHSPHDRQVARPSLLRGRITVVDGSTMQCFEADQGVMADALDIEKTPVRLDSDFLEVRSVGGLKRQADGAKFPAWRMLHSIPWR